MKDTLHLKSFDNQLTGICGLIFHTNSSSPCLYFKLNMIKIKFIISPPLQSPIHPLLSSFLRMTSLVLQATTASKNLKSLLIFLILIILPAVTSNSQLQQRFLHAFFSCRFFFLLPPKLIIACHLDFGKTVLLDSQYYICSTHSAKWFLLNSSLNYVTLLFVTLQDNGPYHLGIAEKCTYLYLN